MKLLYNIAVNDSCLVFDGKLVIDTKFCTNDQHIRAAGPFTKYARRFVFQCIYLCNEFIIIKIETL